MRHLPRDRRAVRAILLSSADDRILLMRARAPDDRRDLWLTPGGGVETGEGDVDALRREIFEETGHRLNGEAALVWIRTHSYRLAGQWVRQHERIYLVRVSPFDPTTEHNPSVDETNVFREFRWWSIEEIRRSGELFVPRGIARQLERLLADGLPAEPVDVGR